MVVKKKRGRPRKRPEMDKKLKQKQKQKQQVVVNVSGGGGGGFIPAPAPQTPAFDYSILANLIRPAATMNVPIAAQTVAEAPFVRPAMEEPLAASKPKMQEIPKKETPPKNIIDPQGGQAEFFEEGTFQDLALDREPASPMMTDFGARKAEGKPLFETPESEFIFRPLPPAKTKEQREAIAAALENIPEVEITLPPTSKKKKAVTEESNPKNEAIKKAKAKLIKYDEDISNAKNSEEAKIIIKKREDLINKGNQTYGLGWNVFN